MADWSGLWDLRNEPFSVITSIGLLIIVVVFSVLAFFQFFFRQAPFYCGGQILPYSSGDCVERTPPSQLAFAPVGSVVAFFGDDEAVPAGWALCDGRDNPRDSQIKFDADSKKGGIQLPDLRGKFIRGAEKSLAKEQVQVGGNDRIDLSHSHIWVRYGQRHWNSFTKKGGSIRVDHWDAGLGHGPGKRFFPLASGRKNVSFYTARAGDSQMDNRPSHAELRFIIRIF